MNNALFLVVIDPAIDAQPALDRAIQTAKFSGGKLHLFQSVPHIADESDADKETRLKQAGQQVLELTQQAILAGIEVSMELELNEDWCEAIIRSAEKHDAFMVFKSSYQHNQAERSSDVLEWTLLRKCPCPVLILHDKTEWENRRVLAAIDLATTDKAHKQLNEQIITIASTFQQAYGSDVHYINAVSATKKPTSDIDDDLFVSSPLMYTPKVEAPIEVNPEAIKQACGDLDDGNIHIVEGNPLEGILATSEEISADLIIVGTVARTGIKGRILGNMSEKLLDRTSCDILSLSKNTSEKVTAVPFA